MSGVIVKWVSVWLLLLQPVWSVALEGDKKVWEKETRDLFYEGESSQQESGTYAMDTLSEKRGEARKQRDRDVRQENESRPLFGGRSGPPAWLTWLGYAGIGLIVIFLLFLVIRAIDPTGRSKSGNPILPSTVLDDNPESLEEAGLEDALQMALDRNDLRLAVRVMFLDTLRHLEKMGIILWRKSKTNRQYVTEAGKKMPVDELKRVVMIYEQVWFGNVMVSDQFLDSYRQMVQKLTGRNE